MKVLHVLYSGLGGHGNVLFSMADADREKEVTFEALFFGIEDVRQEYLQKARLRGITAYAVKKQKGFDNRARKEVRAIVKKSAPDILFLHGSGFIFFARNLFPFAKNPKIIVRETQPGHLKTKADWVALSYSLLFADKVVFLNPEFRVEIKKKFSLLYAEKRTAVIPNGIDLAVYRPLPQPYSHNFRIGMQSRLSLTKDHETLIRAYALCIKEEPNKHITLHIAGEGSCRTKLESVAKGLEIGHLVEFTGLLEEQDLPVFINSLNIYIHATLGEMMSTAIMQVMACRKAVIASDVFGVNNMIIAGETGVLVPASDEKKLAAAILSLAANPHKVEVLATNAYETAQNYYGNELMFKRYKKLFKELRSSEQQGD